MTKEEIINLINTYNNHGVFKVVYNNNKGAEHGIFISYLNPKRTVFIKDINMKEYLKSNSSELEHAVNVDDIASLELK